MSGGVVQLRAFIADDQNGATRGGCRATVARGHRVVGLPCGRQHNNACAVRGECSQARRGARAAALQRKGMHSLP